MTRRDATDPRRKELRKKRLHKARERGPLCYQAALTRMALRQFLRDLRQDPACITADHAESLLPPLRRLEAFLLHCESCPLLVGGRAN